MRRFNDLYQTLTKVVENFYKVKRVYFHGFSNTCNILMYFTTNKKIKSHDINHNKFY